MRVLLLIIVIVFILFNLIMLLVEVQHTEKYEKLERDFEMASSEFSKQMRDSSISLGKYFVAKIFGVSRYVKHSRIV
jgi:hypothetical protein